MSSFKQAHVVTVLYNNAGTLPKFFDSLLAQGSAVGALTLVDNGSSDGSLAEARRLARSAPIPVRVLANSNTGFAGGYWAAAATDIGRGMPVLCLNPDVAIAPGAVGQMLAALALSGDIGIVTMPLVDASGAEDTASRRRLPALKTSMVYAVLGRRTPSGLRYNGLPVGQRLLGRLPDGTGVTALEATTGALMLVAPAFRSLDSAIFDRDYWMYGEDLQLCADAARAGLSVVMVEGAPSLHLKGASAGRPRSARANRAFHNAMYLYARKNLVQNTTLRALLRVAVYGHFVATEVGAIPARARRKSRARSGAIGLPQPFGATS